MMTDDELEPRLLAWFQEGPGPLPSTSLEAVRTAIHARPQRSTRSATLPLPSRRAMPPVVDRRPRVLAGLAVAAMVVVALIGLRFLPDQRVALPPSMSPEASASPSGPPSDPTLLDGRWSTLDPAPGLPAGHWELSLGEWAIVSMPAFDGAETGSFALWLRPLTIAGDEVRIAAPVGAACVGIGATYRWAVSDDDILRLDVVDDACAERVAALGGRAWFRAWPGPLLPGRTYATDQAPVVVRMTIPAGVGDLEGTTEPEWYTHTAIEPGTGHLVLASVVRQTYIVPCDITKAYRRFDGTAEDLADWLSTIPEVDVLSREPVEVGGRPAIRLRFSVDAAAAAACVNGTVAFWTDPGASDVRMSGGARQGHRSDGGTTEEMTIVEVDDEVLAITAQAPTPVFDAWLEAVGPMIDSARFGD
jgi:hypothetical protein